MATNSTPLAATIGSIPGDAQAIIDTVKAMHTVQIQEVGGKALADSEPLGEVMLVPVGMMPMSTLKFRDEMRDAPRRRKGQAKLGSLDSFIAHANRFKDADSAIFAQRDEAEPGLLSVLNYHPAGPAGARFGDHQGRYDFPLSEQWLAWKEIDGRRLSQPEFAAFLEERIMDIMPPPTDGRSDAGALALDLVGTLGGEIAGPTRLLEVARSLKLLETAEVTNAQNLNSGEMEITFRTQHADTNGQPLRVPNLFLVGMPVFDGDAAYRLPMRLQYRRNEGRISWTIRRYRPELVFFHAFDEATKRVAKETDLPVLIGTPEG